MHEFRSRFHWWNLFLSPSQPLLPNKNIPALFHMMAWCRPGNKALSEPMMFRIPTHLCATWPHWVDEVIDWLLNYEGYTVYWRFIVSVVLYQQLWNWRVCISWYVIGESILLHSCSPCVCKPWFVHLIEIRVSNIIWKPFMIGTKRCVG